MTIYVKPAPGLPAAAAKVLKSDNGVGLLDPAGNVPEAGMPWPSGGLTLTLLRDGVIVRAAPPSTPGFTAWAVGALAAADVAVSPANAATAAEPHEAPPASEPVTQPAAPAAG